jgi:hypothetical protein
MYNITTLVAVACVMCIMYKIANNLIKSNIEPYDEPYGESYVKSYERPDLLLTDYYKRFVPSKTLDNLPKHMRIHHSGNPMYTSNKPPTLQENCQKIDCPPLVEDDITPNKFDHYDPFPQKSNSNLTCWGCL